ncbi:DMT family transporter [Microterricola viridarii]|uniref:EamA domain-containing protein n=1 Tax=Microterricola viridarii TaxID=412690 RepID=A0A0X8E235_9MICO|nr:DMT family transporter [Microterricola viridarii]AMB58598.1 hypothetical protein AWU67_06685 [Microterricola viridarii]
MGALLALVAAVAYGVSDFVAGVASRRASAVGVTAVTLFIELLANLLALAFFHGSGPVLEPLLWGALSGVGSAVGTLALYHGFAVGRISVVATLSGVLTVVIPAITGLLLGNQLSPLALVGIIVAIPAIGLVSWNSGTREDGRKSGALFGVIAGVSFSLLFIALERAGTGSGAWPLVCGQAVACALIAPVVIRGLRAGSRPRGSALLLSVIVGLTGAAAGLAYLLATGFGQLAVVAVLTSMYPAVTVLLARVLLHETWSRLQALGLITSAIAVVMVGTSGSP